MSPIRVRTEELLPQPGSLRGPWRPELRIDLQRLVAMPARHTGPLARYACAIQQQRDDHNGKVLTIREHDLRSLARVYDVQQDNLAELLVNPGALTADPSAGAADRTHQIGVVEVQPPLEAFERVPTPRMYGDAPDRILRPAGCS